MSICPYCKKSVKKGTANKTKRKNVWHHKVCKKECSDDKNNIK